MKGTGPNLEKGNSAIKILLATVALNLLIAGLYYLYWGVKIGFSRTVNAVEKRMLVLLFTIAVSGIILFTGFLNILVMKSSSKRILTCLYTFLLFFCLIFISGVMIAGPFVQKTVEKEFEMQCSRENMTSDMHKGDIFYQ